MAKSIYARFKYKRLFDLILISMCSVFLIILFLVVATCLYITYGSPILFKQKRPGYLGRLFHIYKFRTMTDARDKTGKLLPDRDRLTTFGRILRKTSLDELPEIWNVIVGDMSLVGPRPLLEEYFKYLTEEERKRYLVKPGITGLAQISGRNYSSWGDRLKKDIYYVNNGSLLNDVAILAKTILKVACWKDVAVDPRSIMLNLDEERRNRK